MTEHDGLTAEQEAGRVWSTKRDQIIFVRGANWATEREKARVEAAEARVDQLMQAIIWMSGSDDFGPGKPAHDHWVEIRDTLLFPPTTEAVTEVEGS